MEKKSESKHLVISGGARGLGYAMVKSLLAKGYCVSTFSRSQTKEIEALCEQNKDRLFFKTVDLSQSAELQDFVSSAVSRQGAVYGVINNAAVVRDGILATLPEVEISKMIATNLEGAFRLTRLCLKTMLPKSTGRVINISSIIGTRGYNGLTVYSATKAGLDGFSRSLAREVGRRNITVNSVGPGYMKTTMSSALGGDRLGQIIRRTPMGRLADLDDVLPLINFLLSDEARFITGQTILVDGGISC